MLSSAVLTLLTAAYPDALDHLRAGDVVPQVALLLDRSCSMGEAGPTSNCSWFANIYNSGSLAFNKNEQLKAVLTGCLTSTDGILDTWADRVNFSMYEFGSGTTMRAAFGSTLPQLEAAALALPVTGSTYMSQGLKDTGVYFNTYFNDSNTKDCRPNFIVMLSDGNPNGGSATFNHECTAPVESKTVSSSQPWFGSDYLYRHPDLLCSVTGNQNIRTYTIGLGAPGSFNPANLQNIADYGGGEYYYASDSAELSSAFTNIIGTIVSKSALFFAPIAIQTESMFAENWAYTASFKPQSGGPWRGTVKKYCVVPPVKKDGSYDSSVTTCLFASPDGKKLETNPSAEDQYTGIASLAADIGGAGEVILDQLGTTAGGAPAAPYWGHRKLYTWREGVAAYVPVTPNDLTAEDTWTNGCQHAKLINFLHGYTFDADCDTGDPIAAASWPLGDPVGFSPVLLKYGACHDSSGNAIAGRCYVVAGMNDGILHILDAATGVETSGLVPAELWKPGDVPRSILRDIFDQPGLSFTHRYYVDGDARLFHADTNADGIIQPTETASLIFGLGRGGRAYYLLPVNKLSGGVVSAANNPIAPLLPTEGTPFDQLGDTWAAPWLGMIEEAGVSRPVAVFGSGHLPNLDFVAETSGGGGGGGGGGSPPAVDLGLAQDGLCAGSNGLADQNGYPTTWCDAAWISGCKGTASKPCYDSAGTPLDLATPPLQYNDGVYTTAALRLYFKDFDLGSGDKLRLEDSQGNLIATYTGTSLKKKWSDWVYDDKVVLRLVTDGVDSKNLGYRLEKVQWVPGVPVSVGGGGGGTGPGPDPEFELGVDHHPSLYFLDVDRWNGATRTGFAAAVTGDGLFHRFTNQCTAAEGTRCSDVDDFPDLANFVCPISAEISGYTEGGVARAFYFGDECAQLWKAWQDTVTGKWKIRRLINLNNGKVAVDKDHRKIFRRLDLVLSGCPGREVIGVYFGTGDIQRPTAKDELTDPAATDGKDLLGVLWDYSGLPAGLTDQDLADVTNDDQLEAPQIWASGKFGWRYHLKANERMLRDPLVFDRVAYFKTYEPTNAAGECGGGSGVDRIYALESCSAAAEIDVNGNGTRSIDERQVWNGETEIGGGLFFFTPKDSPVLVSHADITKKQDASLNTRSHRRPKLFLWREK